MAVGDQLVLSAGPAQGGMLVARVGGHAPAGPDVDHGGPGGHEQAHLVALAKLVVHVGQGFAGRLPVLQVRFDQHPGDHHEQCRRNALAGYVSHHQADVVAVNQEEVVEVAADLLGGGHAGEYIEFRPRREGGVQLGQLAGLDGRRHAELRADALLFRGDLLHLVHILQRFGGQVGEGLRQHLDLVPGPVGVLHEELQFLPAERSDFFRHRVQRFHDARGHGQRANDAQHGGHDQQDGDGLFGPVQVQLIRGLRPVQDAVVLGFHRDGGLVRGPHADGVQHGPADPGNGGAGQVPFLPVRLQDAGGRKLRQGACDESGKVRAA